LTRFGWAMKDGHAGVARQAVAQGRNRIHVIRDFRLRGRPHCRKQMANSHSADGRQCQVVRLRNHGQLIQERLDIAQRKRHRDQQGTRMPLINDVREIRQGLPENMLILTFDFAGDRCSQLRAISGQHGIAAGSAKANRP